MKSEFNEYLKMLAVSNIVKKRSQAAYELFSTAIGENIDQIFISDFINQDGLMQFDTLWFFSKNYLMQAKNFLQTDSYEIMPYKSLITNITIELQNFDFKDTNEKSRLNLRIKISPSGEYYFKSSNLNCNQLKNIYFDYFLKNILDVTADAPKQDAK
jgi:hypothetical protein